MSTDDQGQQETFDRIDADAVCEHCATVNPPGTLLCKECGNNLRDQRQARMAAEAALETPEGTRPRRVLSALLTVLGLLIILYAALNINRIEEWLVAGMTTSPGAAEGDPADYWNGPDAALYESLEEQAREMRVPRTVRPAEGPLEDYTGGYVISLQARGARRTVGQAAAEQQGDTVHFAAIIFGQRPTAVRGRGTITQTGAIEVRLAGIKRGDDIMAGFGFAERRDDAALKCFASTSESESVFEAALLYVP